MTELKAYSMSIPPSACIPCFSQQLLWRDYINTRPDTAALPRHHRPPILVIPEYPCPVDFLCNARCSPYWPDPGLAEGLRLPTFNDDRCGRTICKTAHEDPAQCRMAPGQSSHPSCFGVAPRGTSKSPYAMYIFNHMQSNKVSCNCYGQ